jgi:hypothetical protein
MGAIRSLTLRACRLGFERKLLGQVSTTKAEPLDRLQGCRHGFRAGPGAVQILFFHQALEKFLDRPVAF